MRRLRASCGGGVSARSTLSRGISASLLHRAKYALRVANTLYKALVAVTRMHQLELLLYVRGVLPEIILLAMGSLLLVTVYSALRAPLTAK